MASVLHQFMLNNKEVEKMKVVLLGYLNVAIGQRIVEISKDSVVTVKDVVNYLVEQYNIRHMFFKGDKLWEGIIFMVNGKIIDQDFFLEDCDELVITLPTAGG